MSISMRMGGFGGSSFPSTVFYLTHACDGQTMVEVQQWSINHSKDNWADPWSFRPERFLSTPEEAALAGNKLDALQPFSIGPRNCIGRKYVLIPPPPFPPSFPSSLLPSPFNMERETAQVEERRRQEQTSLTRDTPAPRPRVQKIK